MRSHDDPPFFPLGQIHRACHRVCRPIAKGLPLLVLFLQYGFGGSRGFWYASDAPNLGLVVALHIGLTVAATVKDDDPLLLLLGQLLTQLTHHLFDSCTQMLFVRAIAIQWPQKDWHISIVGGGQCQHPLFEILAMITGIAIVDGYWH